MRQPKIEVSIRHACLNLYFLINIKRILLVNSFLLALKGYERIIVIRLQKVFDNAFFYELFQKLVQKSGTEKMIRNQIIRPHGISAVLDFGCGVGSHSKYFTQSDYLGIEPLESCVVRANRFYANNTTIFRQGDHRTLESIPSQSRDLILGIGVLHHIDDSVAQYFLKHAFRILVPGGRITTIDPVIHHSQSVFSRFVVQRDRGLWVRSDADYVGLFREYFAAELHYSIYRRLLRIPYDHIGIEAVKK